MVVFRPVAVYKSTDYEYLKVEVLQEQKRISSEREVTKNSIEWTRGQSEFYEDATKK